MSFEIVNYDYSGDAIPGLEDESVQVAIFDPPYNIGKKYEDDDTGDKLPESDYERFMMDALFQVKKALRPGGLVFYWCNADQGDRVWKIGTERGFELLWGTPIIWWERFSQYQKKRFTQDFRFIFPFQKPDGPLVFHPDETLVPSERMKLGDKRAKDSKGRVPGRVWTDRRLQGTAKARVPWHPLQLPPEQLGRIIRGFSNPGDLVLDGFAGSGSAGVVALNADRSFVGVDKSPTYCRLIRERLESS